MSEEIVHETPTVETPAPSVPELDTADLESLYDGIDFNKGDAETEEAPKEEGEAKANEQTPAETIEYSFEPPEELSSFKEMISSGDGKKEYEDFQAFAKENGIKPETFNHLMTKYATNLMKTQEQVQTGLVKQWEDQQKTWHAEVMKDPEIGGQNYTKTKENLQLAMKEFGSETLAKELKMTGFGSHPEFVRFIARAGASIGEGAFVKGKPVPSQVQPWEKLYK